MSAHTCTLMHIHTHMYTHTCVHTSTQALVHVPINIHIQFKPELQSYNFELHNHSEPVFPPL